MKAVRIHAFGPPDVLKLEDAAVPNIKGDEVLVRMRAAGINPVDAKTRAGGGVARPDHAMPITLGWDVSGTVDAIGSKVTKFAVGDEVFGMPRFPAYAGAYAQFTAANEAELAHKPRSVDHLHAAAVPMAALTAWQALFDTAELHEGQRVLIQAAAGGVGHVAVQLAKAAGAHVVAITSARNADFVRALGADELIDYTTQSIEQVARDIDIAFDGMRGDDQARLLPTLKANGMLVSIVGLPAREQAVQMGLNAVGVMVRPHGAEMAEIAKLIDAGALKLHVSHTFPLAAAAEAHREIEAGHTRGKIVLEVTHSRTDLVGQ